jgi:hypothetical protein
MIGQIYDFALTAGGTQVLEVTGEFVKVISSTGLVRIEADTGARLDALAGQGFRKDNFTRLVLRDRSNAVNVGRLFVAYGDMIDDRVTGDVSIIDAVSASCVSYGAGGFTAIGFSANPVILPGANTDGVIVRSVYVDVSAGAAGAANSRMIAAPSAPASLTPAGASLVLCSVYNDQTTTKSVGNFDLRRRIPPGWGIYFCVSIGGAIATSNGYIMSLETL